MSFLPRLRAHWLWAPTSVAIALFTRSATTERNPPEFCDRKTLEEVKLQQLDELERYAPRGSRGIDRCEGAQGRKHSLGETVFAGVWLSCELPRPRAQEGLLEFYLPFRSPEKRTRIQIQSMSGSRPYRLDTELAPSSSAFSWPMKLLNRLEISPDELGMRAWSMHDKEYIYAPVSWAGASPSNCASQTYFFRFDWVKGGTGVKVELHPPSGDVTDSLDVQGDYLGPRAWVPVSADRFREIGEYRIQFRFSPSRAPQVFIFHGKRT